MNEGIVNILKPPGMTSSDVVADTRHIFATKRVGHTGTLDPGAAGVLPVCIGRATRLFDYLVDRQKEYIAEIRFGMATDTQDSYGSVTESSGASVSASQLSTVLPEFTGDIEQVAPMYSAVRQDGKKLYQLARAGQETVRKVRKINIEQLELLNETSKNHFLVRMVCSKGTYVRTICHDIGQRMGVPAHLSFLLRTRTGMFSLDNTFTLAQLCEMKEEGSLEKALISIEEALGHIDAINLSNLTAREKRLLYNGARIDAKLPGKYPQNSPLRIYNEQSFVGLGIIDNEEIHITMFLGEGLMHENEG